MSKTSRRSWWRPDTRVLSAPPLSSRRVSSGSTIVGTWAISPAPTTSPIRVCPLSRALGPARRAEHAVLDVAVEVEGVVPTLATDARLAVAAEGRAEVPHEEAVDPHRPGVQRRAHPLGAGRVAGYQRGREPEPGRVGHRDALLLGGEGLDRQDGPEDLFRDDLTARLGAGQDRRGEVEPAEVLVGTPAENRLGAVGDRPLHEARDPLEVRPADQGAHVGGLVARVALDQRRRTLDHALEELVGDV